MDGYIPAGPPPIFRIQLNDGRTVRFPAIFALHADFVRLVRVDAHDSQPRRTHESAVDFHISVQRKKHLSSTKKTTRGAFRLVYGFILQAVKGDKATANLIFEDYLAGKLSKELLSISRRCVSAEQAIAGSSNRDIEEEWHRDKLRAGKGVGEQGLPHTSGKVTLW